MSQQALFPLPDPQGDNPENIYTPDSLALLMCETLRDEGLDPKVVAELHVGGGAFVRAVRKVWPNAKVVGGDLDEGAAGLEMLDEVLFSGVDLVDWLGGVDAIFEMQWWDVILGNPPFDRRPDDPSPASTAFYQFQALSKMLSQPELCWLMPVDLYSVQRWSSMLLEHPPSHHRPITRRVWPNVRGVAFWHWTWVSSCCVLEPIHWDGPDRQRKGDARTGRVSR